MKERKCVIKAFRCDENGYVDYPKKMSNVAIARLFYGNERGCSYCFPHGFETDNSTMSKNRRNWKFHRMHQWK